MIDAFLLEKIVGREVKATIRGENVNAWFAGPNERLLVLFLIHIARSVGPIMERYLSVFL